MSSEVSRLIEEGDALLKKWESKQALERFDRVLELEPGNLHALYGRGKALLKEKRPEEALACAEQALRLAPMHPEVWKARFNKAFAFSQLQRDLGIFEMATFFWQSSCQKLSLSGACGK